MNLRSNSVDPVDSVLDIRPRSARDTVRNLALETICAVVRPERQLKRLRVLPRVQFLLLHHVFRDESSAFERLVAFLSRYYRFVSYSEAVRRVQQRDIDKPYLSFSFDDGIENCLEAARILEQFGTTGCFFVCPSMVDETNPHKVADFCRRKLLMKPVTFLASHQIDELLKRGHEIGAHTTSHVDLGCVTTEQASYEIEQSKHLLESQFGTIAHFAWPYGQYANFSAEARQLAIDAGFESIASAERGCHTAALTTADEISLSQHSAHNAERLSPSTADPVSLASLQPSRQSVGGDVCLRRDSVQATWPLAHIAYFLARGARRPIHGHDSWPTGWQPVAPPSYLQAA